MPTNPPKKKPTKLKTKDELVRSSFNLLMGLKQYREKVDSGELTIEDMWGLAAIRADEQMDKQVKVLSGEEKTNLTIYNQVAKYRHDQEKKLRESFEWNTANDEATLTHILDTEAHIKEIELTLDDKQGGNIAERQKLMTQHSQLSDKHKDFLIAAGIDRISREKKKATNEPFDDWIRIKRLGDEKMDTLKKEFGESASKSQSELDLRNAIKHHFGYEFALVDQILSHHRRVLGLDMQLEQDLDA